MGLARLAINRPTLMLMIGLAVVVFSVVAVPRLGLDLLPRLQLPVLAILTVYPNADPNTVEESVSRPIEGVVRTIGGLNRVTSVAAENVSITMAEFHWGTSLDAAVQELGDRLRQVRLRLPESVEDPLILRLDPAQLPMMMVGVSADLPAGELTRRVQERVMPRLEQTPGVAQVRAVGASRREVQVLYDPERLEEQGLSAATLAQVIQYQNMSVPIGTVVQDGKEYPARVGSRFTSVDQVRELVIGQRRLPESAGGEGTPVMTGGAPGLGLFGLMVPQFLTVGDVAEVREAYESTEGYTRVNGLPAILLTIDKESGTNTVIAARAVHDTLRRLAVEEPRLRLVTVFDQSDFIRLSIRDVSQSALIGGILAVVVLFLFLADVWSTLVIALAIPFSVLVTGVAMYFGGLTLNLMSLGGLALGIGMLVDNSIVVLESIFRHREMGEDPATAAVRGTGEVLLAITASTLTTLAVFLPVVFVGGLAGELFRELALTVSMALASSLAVSATFVPLLASLRRGSSTGERPGSRVGWFLRLREAYGQGLRWSLHHRGWIMAGAAVLVLATAAVVPFMATEFIPAIDMGEFSITVKLPPGTPARDTDRVIREIEEVVKKLPEKESFSTQVGSGGGTDFISQVTGTAGNQGTITVVLKRKAERRRTAAEVVAAVREELRPVQERYPQATIRVSDEAMVAGALSSYLSRQVTVEIRGEDAAAIAQTSQEVVKRLRQLPGLRDVSSSLEEARPMVVLDPNRTRLLLGGLTAAQLGLGVREALVGQEVGSVLLDGQEVPVVVKAALPERSVDAVGRLGIPGMNVMRMAAPTAAGGAGAAQATAAPGGVPSYVRVRAVVEEKKVQSPLTVERQDGQRMVTVTAVPVDGNLGAASNRVEKALREMPLPPGVSVRLGGLTEIMRNSFADLRLALVLAVILVYMVMAAQFESLRHPLVIMLTVPLAAAGAILATWAGGQAISIISLVGLIVLGGIAVNNGIVLVDFANQLRRQGMEAREAAAQAGRVRLRPVLMTSITTIVGLIPLAFSRGEGAEIDRPLALSIMGGLTVAMFLTLFVIPVAWSWVEGRRAGERGGGDHLDVPCPQA